MNNKKEKNFLQNSKKYIVIFSSLLFIGAVVGYRYYFYPGTLKDMLASDQPSEIIADDEGNSPSADAIIGTSSGPIAHDVVRPSDNNVFISSNASNDDATKKTVAIKNISSSANNVQENIPMTSVDQLLENNPPMLAVPIAAPSCSFPNDQAAPTSRKIIFNEIAWMGSSSSSAEEWMEIKNISGSDVDLNGWNVMDASKNIKIVFSSGETISSGKMLLLSRNNSSTGRSYSGTLSNVGDDLAIIDPQCNTSDILDASDGWQAGNNTTKQTLERDTDNIGWHTSVSPGGTPGKENSFVVPPIVDVDVSSSVGMAVRSSISASTLPAVVVAPDPDVPATSSSINSVLDSASSTISNVDPSVASSHILIDIVQISGASSTNDLVKLYNPTISLIDMSGWKLHKRSVTGTDYSLKQFPTGSAVAPGQTFLWANAINGFSESVAANVSSTETVSADNSVALLDAVGSVVDAVAWGSGTNQYGEGSPFPTDPVQNQVLARKFMNGAIVDTKNNANDFILQ